MGILVAHYAPEFGSISFNKKELLGLSTSIIFSPEQLELTDSALAKREAICSTLPVNEIFAAWLGVALWHPAFVQLNSVFVISVCMSEQSTSVGAGVTAVSDVYEGCDVSRGCKVNHEDVSYISLKWEILNEIVLEYAFFELNSYYNNALSFPLFKIVYTYFGLMLILKLRELLLN